MSRNNLVIDIMAILAEDKHPITNDCCIYRVPHDIREVNEDAYTPKAISIGPLHHNDQKLQNMEKYKQIYFQQFVARAKISLEDLISSEEEEARISLQDLISSDEEEARISLKDLISSVEEEEPRLRRCYSEDLEMSADKLIKVVLVDACFIVELFYKYYYGDDDDFLKPWLLETITYDLLLLENQIPFFILEKLYNLAFASHSSSSLSFPKLAIHYFSHLNKQELNLNFTISHFTDLLRAFHLQQPWPDRTESYDKHIYTASAYSEAGVLFEKNGSNCILDLQFSERCLKIPHIRVEDDTEMLFRNMVALEQCHYPDEGYITDYVSIMDFLINTGKDVDVLVKNEILLNWLGDNDDVAKLFNGICKNIRESNFNSQYIDVFHRLDAFCNTPWNKMRATLKRDYCNTPWRTVATVAAIAILVFTFIQTVCSIIQVA